MLKSSSQQKPKLGMLVVNSKAKAEFDKAFESQIKKGYDKYGTYLQTFNDLSAYKSAVEELIDLQNYLTQLEMERKHLERFVSEILYNWKRSEDEITTEFIEQTPSHYLTYLENLVTED